MSIPDLSGRLGRVRRDGELPRREDLGLVFDELDYQLATQAYLWALPLVSHAQWKTQHREVFGATNTDVVHYVTYQDRLGLITANATTPCASTPTSSGTHLRPPGSSLAPRTALER